MDCTVLGRVSGKTRGPLGAQDSISYANSHTPSLPEKLIIVVFIVRTISSITISISVEAFRDSFLQAALYILPATQTVLTLP